MTGSSILSVTTSAKRWSRPSCYWIVKTLVVEAPHAHVFFFNDTATTEIYTLSLHDALPISRGHEAVVCGRHVVLHSAVHVLARSEEHTSELQSRPHLVCRLLLEKKKKY